MQIELSAEALKNVKFVARKTGRTPEELAADAVAAAFAHITEARKDEARDATAKALDSAAASETVGALKARIAAAEKAAEG